MLNMHSPAVQVRSSGKSNEIHRGRRKTARNVYGLSNGIVSRAIWL